MELLILFGTLGGWLLLGFFLIWKYGFAKFTADIRGIFEGEDKEDPRLSFGRVFSFLFLLPAFMLIGYAIYKFTNGAGWTIFIGSAIAVVAALTPYGLTKTAEIATIFEAAKGDRHNRGERK